MNHPRSATTSGRGRLAPSRPALGRANSCSIFSSRRKVRGRALLLALGTAAFLTAGTALAASRLTRNYTRSLPLGVYWLRPGLPVTKGDIVDLAIPARARALIVGRYLPAGFHLLKRVVAMPGDRVCLRFEKTLSSDPWQFVDQ